MPLPSPRSAFPGGLRGFLFARSQYTEGNLQSQQHEDSEDSGAESEGSTRSHWSVSSASYPPLDIGRVVEMKPSVASLQQQLMELKSSQASSKGSSVVSTPTKLQHDAASSRLPGLDALQILLVVKEPGLAAIFQQVLSQCPVSTALHTATLAEMWPKLEQIRMLSGRFADFIFFQPEVLAANSSLAPAIRQQAGMVSAGGSVVVVLQASEALARALQAQDFLAGPTPACPLRKEDLSVLLLRWRSQRPSAASPGLPGTASAPLPASTSASAAQAALPAAASAVSPSGTGASAKLAELQAQIAALQQKMQQGGGDGASPRGIGTPNMPRSQATSEIEPAGSVGPSPGGPGSPFARQGAQAAVASPSSTMTRPPPLRLESAGIAPNGAGATGPGPGAAASLAELNAQIAELQKKLAGAGSDVNSAAGSSVGSPRMGPYGANGPAGLAGPLGSAQIPGVVGGAPIRRPGAGLGMESFGSLVRPVPRGSPVSGGLAAGQRAVAAGTGLGSGPTANGGGGGSGGGSLAAELQKQKQMLQLQQLQQQQAALQVKLQQLSSSGGANASSGGSSRPSLDSSGMPSAQAAATAGVPTTASVPLPGYGAPSSAGLPTSTSMLSNASGGSSAPESPRLGGSPGGGGDSSPSSRSNSFVAAGGSRYRPPRQRSPSPLGGGAVSDTTTGTHGTSRFASAARRDFTSAAGPSGGGGGYASDGASAEISPIGTGTGNTFSTVKSGDAAIAEALSAAIGDFGDTAAAATGDSSNGVGVLAAALGRLEGATADGDVQSDGSVLDASFALDDSGAGGRSSVSGTGRPSGSGAAGSVDVVLSPISPSAATPPPVAGTAAVGGGASVLQQQNVTHPGSSALGSHQLSQRIASMDGGEEVWEDSSNALRQGGAGAPKVGMRPVGSKSDLTSTPAVRVQGVGCHTDDAASSHRSHQQQQQQQQQHFRKVSEKGVGEAKEAAAAAAEAARAAAAAAAAAAAKAAEAERDAEAAAEAERQALEREATEAAARATERAEAERRAAAVRAAQAERAAAEAAAAAAAAVEARMQAEQRAAKERAAALRAAAAATAAAAASPLVHAAGEVGTTESLAVWASPARAAADVSASLDDVVQLRSPSGSPPPPDDYIQVARAAGVDIRVPARTSPQLQQLRMAGGDESLASRRTAAGPGSGLAPVQVSSPAGAGAGSAAVGSGAAAATAFEELEEVLSLSGNVGVGQGGAAGARSLPPRPQTPPARRAARILLGSHPIVITRDDFMGQ